MIEHIPYRSVVFAGGGSRCFWQAGFWDAVAKALELRPGVVAAVSAGASTACHVLSGQTRACLDYYQAAHQAFRAKENSRRPTPREGTAVYRGALATVLAGAPFERLQSGPEIRILMTRPPAWAPSWLALGLGYACYELEKRLSNPVHPDWPRRLGFKPVSGTVSQCGSLPELVDLILASSSLPPMTPAMRWKGGRILDGGLVDNAPLALVKPRERPALVLLTRRHPAEMLMNRPGVTYAQPSRPLAISKFENSDFGLVMATFEQGMADGETFVKHGPEALYR